MRVWIIGGGGARCPPRCALGLAIGSEGRRLEIGAGGLEEKGELAVLLALPVCQFVFALPDTLLGL